MGELLQKGWGGTAKPNPSFLITTNSNDYNSSEPAISGEIPTAEPEANRETKAAEGQDTPAGEKSGEGEDAEGEDSASEYEEGKEQIFHKNREVYRLVQVVHGSVSDLGQQNTKSDRANKALAKDVKQ